MDNPGTAGNDNYGMTVLPAGYRYAETGGNLGRFMGRGQYAAFLTSTTWAAAPNASPIVRLFSYSRSDVQRFYSTASTSGLNSAYSVRCVRQ